MVGKRCFGKHSRIRLASEDQLALGGLLFAVVHHITVYITDIRDACHHAGTVRITQSALDMVLRVIFR